MKLEEFMALSQIMSHKNPFTDGATIIGMLTFPKLRTGEGGATTKNLENFESESDETLKKYLSPERINLLIEFKNEDTLMFLCIAIPESENVGDIDNYVNAIFDFLPRSVNPDEDKSKFIERSVKDLRAIRVRSWDSDFHVAVTVSKVNHENSEALKSAVNKLRAVNKVLLEE